MIPESIDKKINFLIVELKKLGINYPLLSETTIKLTQNYNKIEYWTELASTLRKYGNYNASEEVYKVAIQIHENSARIWNNYGVLLREWGRTKEALNAFEKSVLLDPSYPRPLENKGAILERLHRYEEAIVYYKKTMMFEPKNERLYNNIGCCYLGLGNEELAKDFFMKSIQINPNHCDSLFNIAALHIRKKEYDIASTILNRLSQLLPNDAEVQNLQKSINQANNEGIKIEMPPVSKLEKNLEPEFEKLMNKLRGNPKSIFISYAWPNNDTRIFAHNLCKDLKNKGFEVVLDKNFNFDVGQILTLLSQCQNVVVINDSHYVESCLLGKIPITEKTSSYPSFAFPIESSEEYAFKVFLLSAATWSISQKLEESAEKVAAEIAFNIVAPEYHQDLSGLRVFVEGWRIDEIQMIFSNIEHYRSISIVYFNGEHCLAGYPIFDFSDRAYYDYSFNALVKLIDMGIYRLETELPFQLNIKEIIDQNNYIFKDSSLTQAKFWEISNDKVMVCRPSLLPGGGATALINAFIDWIPILK